MTVAVSTLAKTDRNNEIIRRAREGQGEVSLQSIADDYGVSRARVQRIVGEANISIREMKRANKRPEKRECRICNVAYVKGTYAEHCKAAGHRRLTPSGEKVERNELAVRLHESGYNTSEIAEYFEIPQPVVTRILHRAGVFPAGRRRKKGGLLPGQPLPI